MKLYLRLSQLWRAIRWKILFIFGFFSVVSMLLVACLSVALLNVIIRRESAYLIEERLKVLVDNTRRLPPALRDPTDACQIATDQAAVLQYPWPAWSQAALAVSTEPSDISLRPAWLKSPSFAGIVRDGDTLEIRSLHSVQRGDCTLTTFT
jgi:hypothetical protein